LLANTPPKMNLLNSLLAERLIFFPPGPVLQTWSDHVPVSKVCWLLFVNASLTRLRIVQSRKFDFPLLYSAFPAYPRELILLGQFQTPASLSKLRWRACLPILSTAPFLFRSGTVASTSLLLL